MVSNVQSDNEIEVMTAGRERFEVDAGMLTVTAQKQRLRVVQFIFHILKLRTTLAARTATGSLKLHCSADCELTSDHFSGRSTGCQSSIEWHTRWRRWRSRRCPHQRQRTWITWSCRLLFQFVLCGHPTPRCWTSKECELSSRVGLFGRGSAHIELTTIRR